MIHQINLPECCGGIVEFNFILRLTRPAVSQVPLSPIKMDQPNFNGADDGQMASQEI
jgi:hypothetical protein